MNRYIYLLLLLLSFGVSHSLLATDKYWAGTTNNDWNTADNWSPSGVPDAVDNVYIPNKTNAPVIQSGTTANCFLLVIQNFGKLTVNSGATLNIANTSTNIAAALEIQDQATLINNGTITLSTTCIGAVFAIYLPFSTSVFTNSGTLNIDNAYIGFVFGVSDCSFTNTATGTINFQNNTGFYGYLGDQRNVINNQGTINYSGQVEILDFDGDYTFNNSGTLNITSGTGIYLNAGTFTNQACGKTLMTAGSFNSSGTVNNEGYTQLSNALTISGGSFTNSGVLIYGSLSGTITSNNGSVIVNNNPTNSTIFTYTGTFSGTINGIYTNSTATTSAGTFTAPNTFSPSGLSSGSQTLYAKITPSGGACTYIVPFAYTYTPPPSFSTDPVSKSVCSGSSTTFTIAASGATSYQWQVNTGGGFTNLSNTTPYSGVTGTTLTISNVTGLGGYQYRCVATGDGGNTNSNAATLTVNPLPTANILTPASTSITCSTPSLSLTATGGSTYRWDNNSTNAIRTVSTAGTYSVTVTSASGCTAVDSQVITTNTTTPTVSITAANGGEITCNASVIGLTASGGTSYRWDNSETLATRNVNAAGVYSVTVTADNGCTAIGSYTVTTNTTPPSPTLTASPSATLTCNQTSLTLTAGGGTSYHFSGPGIIGVNSVAGTATLNTAGVYSVTVTGANGCTATTNLTISSNTAPPSLSLTAANVCEGSPVALSATSGLTSYTFTGASGTIAGTGNTRSVTGLTAGVYTYTVTASNANGCVASAQASVTVSAPSSATIAYAGSPFTTNDSPVNVTQTGTTGGTYTASPTGLSINSATGQISPASSTPGTYTVTYSIAANGACPAFSTTATVGIQVAQADLSVTITDGQSSVQAGSPLTYTIIVTNNGPSDAPNAQVADTFPASLTGITWTASGANGGTVAASGSGNINETVNLPAGGSVTFLVTGTLSINATGSLTNTVSISGNSVTDPTPGNNSATDTDLINAAIPTISNFTADPDPVCVGNQVTFTASLGNLSGAYNYTLTNGTSTTTGTSSNANFSQLVTTTTSGIQAFSLTVSSNSQSATEIYELTVSELPAATLTASNGGVITCGQTSLTLTSSGGDDFVFSGPGILSQDPEDGIAVINAAGVYSVTVTNTETGCFSTSSTSVTSDTATPSLSITPTSATLTCINTSVTLTANGSGSFLWSTGETSSAITVSTAGTYSVTLTSGSGCTAVASQVISGTTSAGPDYQPLVDFYNNTNGSGWTNKSGWLTNCDPCSWYGVGCTNGRVTSLTLASNQLSGSIPESLTALTNLKTLDLSQNQLTGGIPSSLSSLTELTGLYLQSNPLGGTIPTSLSALTKLRVLNLSDNQLTGGIPSSLTTLPQLIWLVLANNQLSGSIPPISSPINVLYLNSNQLSGCFPSSLAASVCPNLQYGTITLSNNAGLPDGGSSTALHAFCNSGQGSDTFVPVATASLSAVCTGGVVSLSTTGGSSYNWIAPSGTVLISGATTSVASASLTSTGLQTFTVVVSNGAYCSQTATVGVTVNQTPTVSITPTSTTLTCASPSATLTANGSGSFLWSTGETTSAITVSETSTYSVTLTSGSGCTATASASVQADQTAPSLSISPTSATLTCANPSATLTANGSGSFLWSTGETTSAITVSETGTYSVTLTNGSGCTATASASVQADQTAPTVSISPTSATLTCASPSATLTANGTGSFLWSTGETSSAITVSEAATYSVTLTSGSGCTATASASVQADQTAPSLSISPTSATLTCASPSATLTANGSGSFLWSTGETTSAITVSETGTYSVTLTNGSGCTATASASVQADQTAPTVSISPTSATLTCASPSATLTANGSGSFLWSTGETTSAITVSETGTYSVTLTNGSGCTATASASVQADQTAPSLSISPTSATLTCASPSATLTANGSGSFLWSTGETTSAITVSETGTYSVTLTNGSGCTATASASVQADQTAPTVSISPTSATLTCASPSATLTANGTGSFLWSTGETSSAITVSEAATYSVTLTSGSGCTATASASVQADQTAPSLSISPTSATLTCANPSATLTANGTGSFLWSTGETSSAITVSEAGTYSVTLTSGSGCTATASASVQADQTAPSLSISPTSATLTCASPSATLTANGTGSFLWSTGETNSAITVSEAGTYSVTLTSGSGCTATASASVQADQTAPSLSISPTSATLTCASPSATLTANGSGSFLWSTGETTSAITVSETGTYSVTLTNGSGCTATASASVQADQTAPTVSISPTSATLTCASPSATLTANGTGSFLWSTGETSSAITVSEAATYSVTLTSGSGCTATASASVQADQTAPSLSISPTSATLTCASPSATLTANGTGSFLWSTGETNSAITVSEAGTYSVTLTSGSGCTAIASASVEQLTNQTIAFTQQPASASSVTVGDNVTVNTSVSGQANSFQWYKDSFANPVVSQTSSTLTLSNVQLTDAGSYSLVVTGACNSLTSTAFNLSVNPVVSAPFAITSVTLFNCTPIDAYKRVISFQPNYTGLTGQPISFSVVNEMVPTTASGPYTLQMYIDNPVIVLNAIQQGTPQPAVYSFNWQEACQNIGSNNTPPTLVSSPANQTLTENQAFSLNLGGVFTDNETPNNLTLSATGLPNGLSLNGVILSGSPSQPGTTTVTLTAADPGGLMANTSFMITVIAAPQGNTPPTLVNTPANQTATQGQPFSLNLDGVFTDNETPNSLTLSAAGLPNGLTLVGTVLSGTPSQTGISTVTLTATDPGNLSTNTHFMITVLSSQTPGNFAIQSVTTINCTPISDNRFDISFQPNYTGLNGQTVTFSVYNELIPTTKAGPYSLQLYPDNPVVLLQATQQGSEGMVSFSYNWLEACQANPLANTAPWLLTPVANQTATAGQFFSLNLAGTFTDGETPNSLVLTASGLPGGFNLSGTTLSGTTSQTGTFAVMLTATDPGNLSTSTNFEIVVSPTNSQTTTPGSFAITGVSTVNCEVLSAGERRVSFTPQYDGVTGQPISFSVVNEMVPTIAAGPYTLNLYTDNPTITLKATQQGTAGEASYSYNWLAACTVPAPARIGVTEIHPVEIVVLGNPVADEFLQVEIRGSQGQQVRLQIVDQQGNRVSDVNRKLESSQEKLQLKLGATGGLYLLQVESEAQRQTIKIVKQ